MNTIGKHTVTLDDPPPYNDQSRKHSRDDKDEPETHIELTFNSRVSQMLVPYRKTLEEMRHHQTEETSHRARNLSIMLMWSVVDQSLFFNGAEPVSIVALPKPAVNISLLESVLVENQSER